MTTTWNSSDKHADITLSGSDLIATHNSNTAFVSGRATDSKTAGKWYWETVINTVEAWVGVANATASLSSFLGADANAWGFWSSNDGVFNSGASQGAIIAPLTAGTNIGFLLNLDVGTVQVRVDGDLGVTPVVYTLGYGGASYPAMGFGNGAGGAITGKFTAASFTYGIPSGYSAFDAGDSTAVSFTGTVPNQTATVGVAFELDLASYFSGSLTPFTYTETGPLPTNGLSLSGSKIVGTPVGVISAITVSVTATDTGSNTATTNSFTISFVTAAQQSQRLYFW